MKTKGTPIRLPEEFRDLVDNIRATRRSKSVGVDKKMLSQTATCSLMTKFFKENNECFLKLIKFGIEEHG